MTLEEVLPSLPVEQWKAKQIYSFDWYDGPREGACSLSVPECEFYFELLDERYNPEGLDDRLYRLSELTSGSVREFLSGVRNLVSPDPSVREDAKQRLGRIKARKRPTPLVIYTQDMEHFLGCWSVDRTIHEVTDWFAFLNIPQAKPTSAA